MKPNMPLQRRYTHSGFSLVELMVAVTIGLLILAGMTGVFVKSNKARDEVEKANRQIENGRYAIQLLTDDLRMAGFYGELDPSPLAMPTTKPDACASDLPGLRAALPLAIQGYDGGTTLTCLTGSTPISGKDILVIRRASTCLKDDCDDAATAGTYFQASLCNNASELDGNNFFGLDTVSSALQLHKKDCTTLADVRRYRTRIYFIDTNDNASDGIPTLKRADLVADGFTIVPLVEGIEDFQAEYGIDTDCDGSPDFYTPDPDTYTGTFGAACGTVALPWQNVIAVKLHVLARNIDPTVGYTDSKTYVLGTKVNADGTSAGSYSVGPFQDQYKRHVYETVVRLDNPTGRISK